MCRNDTEQGFDNVKRTKLKKAEENPPPTRLITHYELFMILSALGNLKSAVYLL